MVVVLTETDSQNKAIMGNFWMFCQRNVEQTHGERRRQLRGFLQGEVLMSRRSALGVANAPQKAPNVAFQRASGVALSAVGLNT